MRAVGCVSRSCLGRVEVSLETWGPDPVLCQTFAIHNRMSFSIGKTQTRYRTGLGCHVLRETSRRRPRTEQSKDDTELGQAPTSLGRPRDKDHLPRSNLAARTLSSVDNALSNGCDLCPVRRGLVAAVKCYVRKTRLFLRWKRTEMTQITTVSTAHGGM